MFRWLSFVGSGFLCRHLPLQISNFVAQRGRYLCGLFFGSLHARMQLLVAQVQRNHQNGCRERKESVGK